MGFSCLFCLSFFSLKYLLAYRVTPSTSHSPLNFKCKLGESANQLSCENGTFPVPDVTGSPHRQVLYLRISNMANKYLSSRSVSSPYRLIIGYIHSFMAKRCEGKSLCRGRVCPAVHARHWMQLTSVTASKRHYWLSRPRAPPHPSIHVGKQSLVRFFPHFLVCNRWDR